MKAGDSAGTVVEREQRAEPASGGRERGGRRHPEGDPTGDVEEAFEHSAERGEGEGAKRRERSQGEGAHNSGTRRAVIKRIERMISTGLIFAGGRGGRCGGILQVLDGKGDISSCRA